MVKRGFCNECGREKMIMSNSKICSNCYRRLFWKRKKFQCKKCNQEKPIHAKGYCKRCYDRLFHYDKIKSHNVKKLHNLDLETYRKITKSCIICGFDKIIDLHHLDRNKKNNSETNLIGLCPNHHRMIHMFEHQQELFDILKEKGFIMPES